MQKTRLPNKTQWALLDITVRCKSATGRWDKAMKMAEKNLDPAMMHLLAYLRDDIAFIDRTAIHALNGEYDQDTGAQP